MGVGPGYLEVQLIFQNPHACTCVYDLYMHVVHVIMFQCIKVCVRVCVVGKRTYWCGSGIPVLYSQLKLEEGGREGGRERKEITTLASSVYVNVLTSEKKFMRRSHSLLSDRNMVFISD